jgi:uncharacterized protein HemY
VSDNYQHTSNKPKILDVSAFEDAVEVSESQEDEIEKYMRIDAGHVKLNDLLDWWKTQEKELKHLPRISRHVGPTLCACHQCKQRKNVCAAGLVQVCRTSSESVDSILLLHKNLQ